MKNLFFILFNMVCFGAFAQTGALTIQFDNVVGNEGHSCPLAGSSPIFHQTRI
ncbi:MAG: hypothetical protein IPN20_03795 [Haliscomenobacter sp.]|nr:hypothetical protein [Haliscomenobacter sp.]